MLISAANFVLNDSLMKTVIADAPPFQVLFVRSIFATLWLLGLIAAFGQWKSIRMVSDRFVLWRGLAEIGSILTYILALANAAQANVMAIYQTTPLLIIIAMNLVYGEALGKMRLIFVLVGFAGAIAVAQPGSAEASPFLLFAFLSAFFSAIRDLLGRRIPAQVPVLVATLATTVLVMLGALIAGQLFEIWISLNSNQLMIIFAAAFLVNFGHIFTIQAFKTADAQAVAPFYYA
ncbi:MAG: DMT family transporter, partial [Rhizobiaceae bacterium]